MRYWKDSLIYLKETDPIFKKYASNKILLKKNNNYFDFLFKSICSQQVSTSAAKSIYQKSKKIFNELTVKKILANLKLIDSLPITQNKKKSIYSLVFYLNDNKNLKWNKLSDKDIYSHLINIFGIGPWTIEMFLIFYKGSQNIIPIKDLGFLNSYKKFYKDENLTKLNHYKLKWSPYGTVITMNLWNSYDLNTVNY